LEAVEPIYACPYLGNDDENIFYVYRNGTCDVLQFTRTAAFYLWHNRILCHPLEPHSQHLVELYFLGTVISYWMELHDILALHASAVAINGRAAAFLAAKEGGKSSIAATFMQAGYPLLTDDLLAIERSHDGIICRSGYPNMRLWPDEAKHFLGYYRDLETVHPAYTKRRIPVGPNGFGTFCNTSPPLGCIYLPRMRHSENKRTAVEISTVRPRDAVVELIGCSSLAPVVKALGLHAQRLDFLAQAATKVPMRRIDYPYGLKHLPVVREAVLKDLESGV
jgi:hypothetical protein